MGSASFWRRILTALTPIFTLLIGIHGALFELVADRTLETPNPFAWLFIVLAALSTIVAIILEVRVSKKVKQLKAAERQSMAIAMHKSHWTLLSGIASKTQSITVDLVTQELLDTLEVALSVDEKTSVRACYYAYGTTEEDKGRGDDIPEYLRLLVKTTAKTTPRHRFTTENEVGRFLIPSLLDNQEVLYFDIGKRKTPAYIRDDPRYIQNGRPYRGFVSLAISGTSLEADSRLIGMLSVDFNQKKRPNESDLELIRVFQASLTAIVRAAEEVAVPKNPLLIPATAERK